MFTKALRNKFRFPFKGQITVEDLWDLSLDELNVVYKTLMKEVRLRDEDSLPVIAAAKKTDVDTKIDIVKYIAEVKQQEDNDRKLAVARKVERDKLMAALAAKQDEALKNMSAEEIQAKLDALEG